MNTVTFVAGAVTILLTVRAVLIWRNTHYHQWVDHVLHTQANPDLCWLWRMVSGVTLGLLWVLVAFGAGGLTSSGWLYVAVWITCQAIPFGLLTAIAQRRRSRGDLPLWRVSHSHYQYRGKVVNARRFPADPTVLMALERDIGNLAAEWRRATSQEVRDAIAQRYHETLDRLCRLEWDGPLGAESVLPDEYMHWEWYALNYGLRPTD